MCSGRKKRTFLDGTVQSRFPSKSRLSMTFECFMFLRLQLRSGLIIKKDEKKENTGLVGNYYTEW